MSLSLSLPFFYFLSLSVCLSITSSVRLPLSPPHLCPSAAITTPIAYLPVVCLTALLVLCKAGLFRMKWHKIKYQFIIWWEFSLSAWANLTTSWCFKYLCPLHQQGVRLLQSQMCEEHIDGEIWRPDAWIRLRHPAVYFNNFHFIHQLSILTSGPCSWSSFITSHWPPHMHTHTHTHTNRYTPKT